MQTTERDEFVYHEMIAHQPMMAHGGVNDVLIIGGGDGGARREVLRHPVDKAVMVEIDGDVVSPLANTCRTYRAALFDDSRAELIIGDGFGLGHVVETERSFDVIIVDSTDPFGPGEILFTDEFYRNCRRVLRRGGVMVDKDRSKRRSFFSRERGIDDRQAHGAGMAAPFFRRGFLWLCRADLCRWIYVLGLGRRRCEFA